MASRQRPVVADLAGEKRDPPPLILSILYCKSTMSALYFIAGLIILYKVGLFKRKTNAEVSDKSLKVGNEIRNTTLLLIVCLSLGAGVLQFLEGLSSSEMLRMFLGQRDILFKSDRGKMFAIVWIFVGLSVLSKLVRHLMEYGCIKMAKCFRA